MRLSPRLLAAASLFAAMTFAAHADTYSFIISTGSTSTTPGTTFTANGTLTGTPQNTVPASLSLTSVTGSAQGYGFTGIVPIGVDKNFTYDNLLFTDATVNHVDAQGILLYLNSPIGTSLAHVYDNGQYHVDVFDPNDPADVTPFAITSFTLGSAATPEPSSFVLLGTGIVGVLAAARRRFLAL